MSVKRQATTELNHDNWDQEDPEEHEEMGVFKTAPKDVLEKRVIRTAKRRAPTSDEEPKKSVFSGFGFNKSQPSSFDFLSKLTNGNNTNGSSNKVETTSTSNLFTNKLSNSLPTSNTSGSNIFGIQSSPNSSYGTTTIQSGSLFGISSSSAATSATTSVTQSPAVSDSPFKIQAVASTSDNNLGSTKPSSTLTSSPKFGIPSSSDNMNKSLFTTSNSTVFKIQPNTTTSGSGTTADVKSESVSSARKVSKDDQNDKKLKYYSKLKGLNESVSDWIKKHVEETPLCILTPIFKDYENYLKEIQDEFHGPGKEENKKSEAKLYENKTLSAKTAISMEEDKTSSLFNVQSPTTKPSIFATQNKSTDKPATFSFGIDSKASPTSTSNTTTTPGFTFGITASGQSNTISTSSPFSLKPPTSTNEASPFSFGAGKPFSFNSNIQHKAPEKTDDGNEEDDTPPKVEFTPVVEENSVYDKRCKIFVKKDGNFADKGVGTLYIKKIEDTGKYQLLVRANTNLGTVLINLILATAIPTQRMGKNNVMMVCIPTPDSKPPPTPILIRVKTPDEADELLETLDKYKV